MRKMLREAPVYHPSIEDMADFAGYVAKIVPKAAEFGICKVIPPKAWRSPPKEAPCGSFIVRGAILQGSHTQTRVVLLRRSVQPQRLVTICRVHSDTLLSVRCTISGRTHSLPSVMQRSSYSGAITAIHVMIPSLQCMP